MYTIGQLAKASGLSPDALRFYERRGLLRPEARTPTGYRLYGEGALRRLAFIRAAQRVGLTLEEIQSLIRAMEGGSPPCRHVRDLLARKLAQVEERLLALEALRAALAQRLAYAEAHPDPACDGEDRCVYLDPPGA